MYMHVCIFVYMYAYIYTHICICVCVTDQNAERIAKRIVVGSATQMQVDTRSEHPESNPLVSSRLRSQSVDDASFDVTGMWE